MDGLGLGDLELGRVSRMGQRAPPHRTACALAQRPGIYSSPQEG